MISSLFSPHQLDLFPLEDRLLYCIINPCFDKYESCLPLHQKHSLKMSISVQKFNASKHNIIIVSPSRRVWICLIYRTLLERESTIFICRWLIIWENWGCSIFLYTENQAMWSNIDHFKRHSVRINRERTYKLSKNKLVFL